MGIVMAQVIEELKNAIINGNPDQALTWAKKAIEMKMNPIEVIEKGLNEALKIVGDAFGRGELFLCDLMMSAEAAKQASSILEEEIKKQGLGMKTIATLVIGTVAGDIHDIGKTLVATLFTAAGFKVIDLGIDVPTEQFIKAVKDYKPDLLGLSALLTVTALEQGKVIEALNKEGLRNSVKVMVGGGAVSREYAKKIGADGYGEDANEAVKVGKELLKL
ncbi:MAG: corrinoid protein [Candidatus Bathyarchaeia archaeon]